jgi:glycerol-3-phosphate dehydrogenase
LPFDNRSIKIKNENYEGPTKDPKVTGETHLASQTFDRAIIGGEFIGCVIARDAAGRGLSIHHCEMSDLAESNSPAGTSCTSTKMQQA